MTITSSVAITADELRDLKVIADKEGKSTQDILTEALSDFTDRKQREHFPELAALIDRTVRRNRRLYELLAE